MEDIMELDTIIFRPHLLIRGVYFVSAIFAAFVFIIFAYIAKSIAFKGFNILWFTLLYYGFFRSFWLGIELTFNAALIVMPEGLEVHGYGVCFYRWEDLQRFTRSYTRRRLLAIRCTPSDVIRGAGLRWFIRPFWIWNHNFIPLALIIRVPGRYNVFPSEVDQEKFCETEFGEALAYYAPHLFEKVED